MADYDNTNTGALFSNKDAKRNDRDPDYKGSLNVGGQEYWVSSWIKVSKAGAKFMSLSVKPKDAPQSKPAPKAPPKGGSGFDDMDDDIPF